jgi:hypothetical protein
MRFSTVAKRLLMDPLPHAREVHIVGVLADSLHGRMVEARVEGGVSGMGRGGAMG